MFKNLFLLASLLVSFAAPAQDVNGKRFEGSWSGTLRLPTVAIDLVFNINQTDTGLHASMDSPDQGALGIVVKEVNLKHDSIIMGIPEIAMVYRGKISADTAIFGTFTQHGQSFEMNLSKGAPKKVKRPQEPSTAPNYKVEEVVFYNKAADIQLAGTLSIPNGKGPFPAIVLVSGSGPQDRDETLLGHKPFLVLADYFTNNGFAVLRYDDRGVGASGGVFETATSADFATDALSALQYLHTRKDINKRKSGIMGHSEGAQIAAMLAAHQKEPSFIVMLAGPGMSGDQILLQQQEFIGKGSGASDSAIAQTLRLNKQVFEIMRSSKDTALIRERMTLFLNHAYNDGLLPHAPGQSKEEVVAAYNSELLTPWMIHFVQYDPQADLKQIKIPVLALIGAKDMQVLAEYNIPALEKALHHNPAAKVMKLEGLNHLFQEATSGLPQEYAQIEQTFSPQAMQIILDWLNKAVLHKK